MYEMLTGGGFASEYEWAQCVGCVPFGNKKFLEVIQLVTKGTRPLVN